VVDWPVLQGYWNRRASAIVSGAIESEAHPESAIGYDSFLLLQQAKDQPSVLVG
jgi:hypothetical protein